MEVRYCWKLPLTVTDVAFFLIRYGIIMESAVILWLFYYPGSFEECRKVYKFQLIAPVLLLFLCNYVMAIRIYAIWGKNKILLGALL